MSSSENRGIYNDFLFPDRKRGNPEDEALNLYFRRLANFEFDRAREHSGSSGDSTWLRLFSELNELASHEKSYHSLDFSDKRWFGRKESLMTSYERVESELKIMLGIFRQQKDVFHIKLAHLCHQLTRFVGIRLALLQHFFSLSQLGSEGKWIDFQIEMSRLEKLNRGELSVVPSPMQVLGSTVKNEIICLERLIDSQLKISSWRYIEAMMALSSCKTALLAWNPPQTVQAKKISWASHVKYPGETNLHLWMRMFHNALIAKATLYFHNSLLPHSMTPSLETKLPPELNYYTRLSQFQRQTSANHVAIVLDTNRLDSIYQGHGYHLPNDASVAKPTGVQAYPAILTIPSEIARQHWPTIISLLTGKPFEATVNPFQIHDKDTLYIACKIDAHMYLVMMYSTRKPPKETPVVSFLSDFVPTLRNAKHYMQIKIS